MPKVTMKSRHKIRTETAFVCSRGLLRAPETASAGRRPPASRCAWASALLFLLAGCADDAPAPQSAIDAGPAADSLALASESVANDTDSIVIDVVRLKEMVDGGQAIVLDARRRDEYDAEHIAGARHVDVIAWREHASEPGGLQDAAYWSEQLGSLGITSDKTVIVVGQMGPNLATAWWLLRYVGVEDCRLLDGTWRQWPRKFYPTNNAAPDVAPTSFDVQFQNDLLIDRQSIKQALASADATLTVVDTRSEGEYSGLDVRGERGGHIPGAVHLPWSEVIDEAGRFLPPAKLKELFRRRGVSPQNRVVAHCQSGGRSSVVALALELAGYENVRNYFGGWGDWSADEDAPVEADGRT